MKIVVCDITGRTLNYDVALCEAISKEQSSSDSVELWCAGLNKQYSFKKHKFFSFIPFKYRNSSAVFARLLKVLDVLFAYVRLAISLGIRHVDVFHLQWFPFISLGTRGAFVDLFFIRLLRKLTPKTKFVFTIHNICPHGMKEEERYGYNPVFLKALSLFDHFIVHTERTKQDVCEDLGLKNDSLSVVYHGVFIPQNIQFKATTLHKERITIIMYGNQNWYKGTDVFVRSLCNLKDSVKNRLHIIICGAINSEYLSELRSIETGISIEWIPRFVDDDLLYSKINESDIIVLPYRRISQSGVLLLAIATNRFIITSNLPTFKETLKGFASELFFRSEDPVDLARLISVYLNKNVDEVSLLGNIKELQSLYSWSQSAKDTLDIYKSLVKC